MKQFPIKGIVFGSVVSLVLGFIAYLAVSIIGIYTGGLQSSGSSPEAIEVLTAFNNSKDVYLLSFPVAALLMGIGGYYGAKKSISSPYVAITFITLLICVAMHFGFNVLTIYKNYIPVVIGCFVGGHVWVRQQKLNQALKQGRA